MGHCVEREVAKSRRGSDVEVQAARQAHYIAWSKAHHIDDPCGPQEGWERVTAIYIKYVILGVNYQNKKDLRSFTARGYATAVNTLFALRKFPEPADLLDESHMVSTLIYNLEREEDIAKQRLSLDDNIFAAAMIIASEAPADSVDRVAAESLCVGRILGDRAGEDLQKTQTKVEEHEYPSGRRVIKARTGLDCQIIDKRGRLIRTYTDRNSKQAHSMRITWRIQKNRQNGQQITVAADLDNPKICPVQNAFNMLRRKQRLNHPFDLPLSIYLTKQGEIRYLTDNKMAAFLRSAVKKAYPETPDEKLKLYSAHSIRVWACVVLSESGKSPDFIKKRLRWMGKLYRVYLRDTQAINKQHKDALAKSSSAVTALLNKLGDDSLPTETAEDETMGDYADIV